MFAEKMMRALHADRVIAERASTYPVADAGDPVPLLGTDRAVALASTGGEIEVDLILNLAAMTTAFVGFQH